MATHKSKNFVGKKWRNFRQVTEIFTDEVFASIRYHTTKLSHDNIYKANSNILSFIYNHSKTLMAKRRNVR